MDALKFASKSTFFAPRLVATLLLGFAGLTASLGVHAALASSDFEGGIDGWLGYSCPNPGDCTLVPLGGNIPVVLQPDTGLPPGAPLGTPPPVGGSPVGGGTPVPGNRYIETLDPDGDFAGRVEPNPAKYAGLYAVGRSLSFDARVISNGGGGIFDLIAPFFVAPLVVIDGAPGSALVYVTTDLPDIDGDWKHYDVALTNGPDWFVIGLDGDGNILGFGNPTDTEFEARIAAMTRLTLLSEWLKEGLEIDTGGIDNFQVIPIPAALPLFGAALLLLVRARRKVG